MPDPALLAPPVLVTGAAGFIGYHVCQRLLAAGAAVLGLDSLTDYYDPNLKRARLQRLAASPRFHFVQLDITDRPGLEALFAHERFARVIHLAAQAGVRHSLTHPHVYAQTNLVGFLNLLEACRQHRIAHLVYASSSSVYGLNRRLPFSEHDRTDHPASLYAATKKANELMAHAYSHLYALPCTGLRFFTVYGPWGRPDMALFRFTAAILAGLPIDLYNRGEMRRDFTYIDDVVECVVRCCDSLPGADPAWDAANPDPAASAGPFRLYNVGGNRPVALRRLVELLEQALGIPARCNLLPMQPGDVLATAAADEELTRTIGFTPQIPLEVGIPRFVAWYREYITTIGG